MNIQTVRKKATYEDLCALPENMVGQIVDGELIAQPRPVLRHSIASNELSHQIRRPSRKGKGGPSGWIFADEPELHFGEQVVVPDIAGWRKENLVEHPQEKYTSIAPDWLCEILSPATAHYDKGAKRRIYGENGVGYMWILDPDALILEVFKFHEGHWMLLGTSEMGEQVSFEPFDAISFEFDVLFPLHKLEENGDEA